MAQIQGFIENQAANVTILAKATHEAAKEFRNDPENFEKQMELEIRLKVTERLIKLGEASADEMTTLLGFLYVKLENLKQPHVDDKEKAN